MGRPTSRRVPAQDPRRLSQASPITLRKRDEHSRGRDTRRKTRTVGNWTPARNGWSLGTTRKPRLSRNRASPSTKDWRTARTRKTARGGKATRQPEES
eukprot:15366262-Heterocapsa_arctica.AAC.1